MINKNLFSKILNKIKPEKTIGLSGLAILAATSLLTFFPGRDNALPTLVSYLSSMGLGVLSNILYEFYSSFTKEINEEPDEIETLELAKVLTKHIQENLELRSELSQFLENSDTGKIAIQILKGNKVALGWIISEIYHDIGEYKNNFNDIRMEFIAIHTDIEKMQQAFIDGFKNIESIFISSMNLWDVEKRNQYLINQYNKVKTILIKNVTRNEFEIICRSLGVDLGSIVSKLDREGTGSSIPNQVQEMLRQFSTLELLSKVIYKGKELRPDLNWSFEKFEETKEWQKINWNESSKRYIKKIQQMYGSMRIMGQNNPVTLDGIFTDVFLLDKPLSWGRYSIDEIRELHSDRFNSDFVSQRTSGLEVVDKVKRLFILGKPGAGKTTFLKYITIQASKGKIEKIPIFIPLKEYSDSVEKESNSSQNLYNYIVEQFDVCDFPDAGLFINYVLKTGKAIILFDGLDEISQNDNCRGKIIQTIKNFSEKYSDCQYLITCRNAATEYNFEKFKYVEMADFLKEQIISFAEKWFYPDHEACESFLTELYKHDNVGLQELARTPLLLTLLCIVFEETLSFPQRRLEIYEEALDALFKKWDVSRGIKRDEIYKNLSLGRKKNMLTQIAYNFFIKSEYFLKEENVVTQIELYLSNVPPYRSCIDIDGSAVLQSIEAQHGIMVERAKGIYSFSHLTYHEYFTSKYIVENQTDGTLDLLLKHIVHSTWREVFMLSTSILPHADDFLMKFEKKLQELCCSTYETKKLISYADHLERKNNNNLSKVGCRIWNIYRDLERAFIIAKTIEDGGGKYFYSSNKLSKSIEYIRDIGDMLIPNETLESKIEKDYIRDFDCYFKIVLSLTELYFDSNVRLELIPQLLDKAIQKMLENAKIIISNGLKNKNDEKFLSNIEYLVRLNFPNKFSSLNDWAKFCVNWNKNFSKVSKIYSIYNETSIKHIEKFLQAANLFVHCLELGYVENYLFFTDNLFCLNMEIEVRAVNEEAF